MRRLAWLAIAVCFLPGCPPDLSGYYIVVPGPGEDGGVAPRDGGGPPPPRDGGSQTGGPCGLPHLLIAAENIAGSGGAGAIYRYELPTSGGSRACLPLTARGQLMGQPFAVAAATDRFVLAAGHDGVQGLDPEQDSVRFTIARTGQHPNDAFALYDPSGARWLAGVAWSNLGSSSSIRGPIRNLIAYSSEGGESWRWDGSALGVSSSSAIASHPSDWSRLLAVHPTNWAAAELDPFGQVLQTSPPLVDPIGGTVLTSIGAGTGGGAQMIAWSGRVDGAPRVLAIDGPFTGDVYQVTCGSQPCEFEHVAVDPTRPRSVIAICSLASGRQVVRLDFARPACETLVPVEAVPAGMRLSYLAFAQGR